jgi:predicted metalloendopeptidase
MRPISNRLLILSELESFEDLVPIIKNIANSGNERFFRMDVKPDYGDTPENWEVVLKSVILPNIRDNIFALSFHLERLFFESCCLYWQ